MLILLLAACGLSSFDSELSSLEGADRWPQDSGSWDSGETGADSGWQDTGSAEAPRAPQVGDLLIHELMINPSAVADNLGEYTELRNLSADWLDLSGVALADEGVDHSVLVPSYTDSLLLAPGGLLVVCASTTGNGGVDCQASIDPRSTGGGFVLANSEDEVLVISASGTLLEAVRYSGDFSPTGAAVGLRPNKQSASANDAPENWCAQAADLSGGDAGTPGANNNGC